MFTDICAYLYRDIAGLWAIRRGQTILSMTVIIGSILAVMALTTVIVTLSYLNATTGLERGYRAQAVASAGANDGILRLIRESDLSGTSTVAVGSDSASVSVTQDHPTTGEVSIISTASVYNYQHSICVIATVDDDTREVDIRSWRSCE